VRGGDAGPLPRRHRPPGGLRPRPAEAAAGPRGPRRRVRRPPAAGRGGAQPTPHRRPPPAPRQGRARHPRDLPRPVPLPPPLPPYAGTPSAELPLDRLKVEDARPVFVFDEATELAFFRAADGWAFPVHLVLAKTGVRIGEVAHLLLEEVDLVGGWLHVLSKPGLGWRVKTGHRRARPLLPEVGAGLRRVVGPRPARPGLLRPRFPGSPPPPAPG